MKMKMSLSKAVLHNFCTKRSMGWKASRLLSRDSRVYANATIHEFNKELEFVFGQPPSAFTQSHRNLTMEEEFSSSQLEEESPVLSHVDAHGQANMVDVSEKPGTKRMAIASCKVLLGENAFRLVVANEIAKGDVLNVAKIAGICGAKQTSNLIPLCHNIMLSKVQMDLSLNEEEYAVEIKGEVTSVGQTGVEMEAMTAVSVAGLTIYDMCKRVSKDIQITKVQLEMKMGGKSSNW
ncbi:hypothetical protein KI387_026781, partial [Taxus chinensis]